jgi:hypothetical protein
MSKFRMKLKVQGLELEIEGSREDASLLSRNIGQQMAGLLQPAGMVLDGHTHPASTLENVIALPPVRKTRRRRNGAASNSSADAPTIINFKHDPAKFGNPRQEWKTADKALWPAPGSEDTELGVLMEPEVGHGEAEVYTRVQA